MVGLVVGCENLSDLTVPLLVSSGDEYVDLDLSHTAALTDNVLRALGDNRSLLIRSLKVAGHNRIVGRRTWRRVASSMHEPLLRLDMTNSLSPSLLGSFSSYCERLQSVRADYCANVTDGEVATLLSRCRALQELSLRKCAQITDKAIRLPERSYLLRLDLRECIGISDRTLHHIAERCPTLLCMCFCLMFR